MPHTAKAPIASIASSLNSDSKPIASTSPRLCPVAAAWRVPNSMAKAAISSATQNATSCHGRRVTGPFAVSSAKLCATARNCKAM